MKCTKCGNTIPEIYQVCRCCGTPRPSQGNYEPKFDIVDYENKQNTYGQQQESIHEMEEAIVSDRKGILILILITLGLFCIGFQFAYNQHTFWAYLFMFAGVGAILLLANVAGTQARRKKDLKLAKNNYQAYVISDEEKSA